MFLLPISYISSKAVEIQVIMPILLCLCLCPCPQLPPTRTEGKFNGKFKKKKKQELTRQQMIFSCNTSRSSLIFPRKRGGTLTVSWVIIKMCDHRQQRQNTTVHVTGIDANPELNHLMPLGLVSNISEK